MKKVLLVLAVVSLSLLSFGQQKQTTTTKTKADTTKVVKKNPATVQKKSTKPAGTMTKKDTTKVKK